MVEGLHFFLFQWAPVWLPAVGAVLLHGTLRVMAPGPKLVRCTVLASLAMSLGCGLLGFALVVAYATHPAISDIRPLPFAAIFFAVLFAVGLTIGWLMVRRRTARALPAVAIPLIGVMFILAALVSPMLARAERHHFYTQQLKQAWTLGRSMHKYLAAHAENHEALPDSLGDVWPYLKVDARMPGPENWIYLPEYLTGRGVVPPCRYDEMGDAFPVLWRNTTNDAMVPVVLYGGESRGMHRSELTAYLDSAFDLLQRWRSNDVQKTE